MIKSKLILPPNHVLPQVWKFKRKLKFANRPYYGDFPMFKNIFDLTLKPKYTENAPYNKQQNPIVTSTNLGISNNYINVFGELESQHYPESNTDLARTAYFGTPKLNKSKSANSSRSNSTYKALKPLRSNLEIRSVFKVFDLNKRGIFNVNKRGIFTRERSEGNLNVISFR